MQARDAHGPLLLSELIYVKGRAEGGDQLLITHVNHHGCLPHVVLAAKDMALSAPSGRQKRKTLYLGLGLT